MELGTLLSTPAWAAATFGGAALGDQRRTQRLVYVAEQLATNPGASLPKQTQGSWADLKAVYRLLREEDVTHEKISQPHWQQTREQANEQDEVVLLVHDDTELDYGYDPAIKGLGPIGNGSHRGLFVHSVLAVVPTTTTELVLGLAYQEPWVRQPAPRRADGRKQSSKERRQRDRESVVWWRAVEQVGRPEPGQGWIHVGDRAADMYPFVAKCRQMGSQFLVRATQNRRLVQEQEPAGEQEPLAYLLDEVKSWPAQGERVIEVPSEHERRARKARLLISWGQVQIQPTDLKGRADRRASPLVVWAIHVWEPDPPCKHEAQRARVPREKHGHKRRRAAKPHPAAESREASEERVEPLEWILLTSVPTETEQQAWRRGAWYGCRWSVEDFHRGLKTGCRIQQRHLREEASLERLLALLSPVAVRLLQLRALVYDVPEQPIRALVAPEEALVIARRAQVPVEQLTVQQFVREVARLGGFLGRTSDGQPGWQTLWEGWLCVQWLVAGMRFASGSLPP